VEPQMVAGSALQVQRRGRCGRHVSSRTRAPQS
jgi:hypothetical protein